jgi:aspartyl protease family protein
MPQPIAAARGRNVRAVIRIALTAGSIAYFAVGYARHASETLTAAEPGPEAPAARMAVTGDRKIAIVADRTGHYRSSAEINGRGVDFIVDTGATSVALTEESARRLGIRPDRSDYRVPVSTANGAVRGARVTLSEIRIGTITVANVEALVIPGHALGTNLLGLSFLNRLRKFEIGGGRLLLTQ